MIKVYCEDCKYYNRNVHVIGSNGYGACTASEESFIIQKANAVNKRDWIVKAYAGCHERNANNDCLDFKQTRWFNKLFS